MDEITCFNDYQNRASATADFPKEHGHAYVALGLNGEAGEYAELIKKMLRDDGGKLSPERRQKALYELGDVLWYLSQSARLCNFTLRDIAEANIEKLMSRKERGKIHGDGDDR
jgi:NTP pyrophosphatase (non-canonical NTP hydrolase)